MPPDRDEHLERAILGLALTGGPTAITALRSRDWRTAELGFPIESISNAKRRAVYTEIARYLSDPSRRAVPIDPMLVRSDLLDTDPEAADEVLACASAAAHASVANVPHYLRRLAELAQRRTDARAEARRDRLAEATAREVREVGGV
ncbi:MAG TPA: hypothetical protein VFN94_10945 [Nitrospiria bacterium]|nr:hypothetical protein [Nitrospiria bacterium]